MATPAHRTGVAHLSLHGGHAPGWLFQRMTRLAREVTTAIILLVAHESTPVRSAIARMPTDFKPGTLKLEFERLRVLAIPRREYITVEDVNLSRIGRFLDSIQAQHPKDFASVLALPGVGPKTARAMALIADLVYGAPTSFRDPATYSFVHGGKDGYPFPVDRALYDSSIRLLTDAVRRSRLSNGEKGEVLTRLHL